MTLGAADFADVPADLPVPPEVREVTIGSEAMSQSAIDWLARFPAGSSLTLFGEMDLSALDLRFGKFSHIEMIDCTLSLAALQKIATGETHVTLERCHLGSATTTRP